MRARVAAVLLALTLGACGGAVPPPAAPLAPGCEVAQLAACEARLVGGESVDRAAAMAYVAAREARAPGDAWARVFRELTSAPEGEAVVIAEGDLPGDRRGLPRVIEVPALPAPEAVGADELALALAEAAGRKHVVLVRAGRVLHAFPDDPLAPFLPGLRPLVDGDAAQIAADVALSAALRAAIEAAAANRFVEAAHEADRLQAMIATRADSGPVRRARYALHLLGNAGLVLDAPAGSTPPPIATPAAPAPGETPYAAYLAVLGARDPAKVWPDRAPLILGALAPDRRDEVAALFVRAATCDAVRPPPMESARDLVFASRLAASLGREATPRPGELGFAAWSARWERAVGLVERTRSAWSYLPAILAQRGEAAGFGSSSSPVQRRVTEMARAHLGALAALQQAEPARHRSVALLGLAVAPGLLEDPELAKAMAAHVEASVKGKLAAAEEPDAILSAVLTGAVLGLSYPPPLKEAHLAALGAATTAKLRGDLLRRAGWGVAALYAADALYRLLAGLPADLDFTARQIARALGEPDLPAPALGALSAAAARYAALAAGKKLDPELRREERLAPERRAAREDLRAALASLGARDEAPPRLLADLTDLTDGLVATLAAAYSGAGAKKAAARASARPACGAQPAVLLDQGTRRALAKLGDVRLRLIKHPAMARGEGTWVRRARAITAILSDAIDLAIAADTGKPPAFVLPAAEVERALREAAGGSVAEALVGAHALGRTFATSRDAGAFVARSAGPLRRLATALVALFGEPGASAGVLDVIAKAPDSGGDLGDALLSRSAALRAEGQADRADLALLAVLVSSALAQRPPPEEAVKLAEAQQSRVAWALRFMKEIKKSPAPDPAAYASGLRRATDDACQVPDAEATIAVMGAIHAHAAGRRGEARAALDRVLAQAEERGLGVPRMIYRYEEKTRTRVFSADIEVSFGAGALLSGSTFQLGLGVRGGGEPESALGASLSPAGSARAGEDAARYYVYAAALATVYHLLDRDAERAAASGRRAVSALASGVVLGARRVLRERPAALGEDAREVLIVAAQLAAEAGMPFLAGDLWTVVRQGFAETLDDRAVASMLDRTPLGLGGIAELGPVARRARRSLAVLAEPMACTEAKVELGAFDEAGCEGYPLALSLRIGGALRKLPRLKRGPETTARCAPLKSLDTFLAAADTGTYDPDAFARAVEELAASGKIDDAAVLLARHKLRGHCAPGVVALSRMLGRRPSLGAAMRADLLSSAINCTAAASQPEVAEDLLALDEQTQRLPDASRNLELAFSIADLAARQDRWDLLGKLVDRPDFVGRWLAVHPTAAAAALVLDHAAAALRNRPIALERTAAAHRLVCEAHPAPERAAACADVAALRAPGPPPADRQRIAREAVRRLLTASSRPAKKP